MNLFDLTGKVAIVTGAAVGLGQGIAVGLAQAGADIVAVGLGDLTETKKLVEKLGRRYLAISADLSSLDPISNIIEQVKNEFGRMDILVNNAGIIRREPALDFSVKNWDDVMNVNLRTLFFLSQAVAKEMVAQNKGGKIINIASMLSYQGGIIVPSYTASKSAVKGLTMALANEWAKYNINVNAIAPGYMATDNTAQLRADENRNRDILARIPQGRWGTPDDLVGTAIFLSSKASDYVSGFTIAVDGGWLSR